MIGQLPQKLKVGNRYYRIRTDFRDILKILVASNDPELLDEEKIYICLFILYPDFEQMLLSFLKAFIKATEVLILKIAR